MVDAARGWLGTRRVGHLGTLDPQATGVLPLAVREATKLVSYISFGDKSYAGTVRLGVETDTLDGEGRVVRRHEGSLPCEEDVRRVLALFRGEIEQGMREADDPNVLRVPHEDVRSNWRQQRAELVKRAGGKTA